MKTTNIIYWTSTILFSGFMIFSAVPNIMVTADSVRLFHDFLGYPTYIIAFLGVAKLAGSLLLLVPALNRLKEWAYAGLMYDLVGATYSIIAMGATFDQWAFMILPISVCLLSYIYHHKRARLVNSETVSSSTLQR